MSFDEISRVAAETGWSQHTQICVLCDYIDNQQSEEAFKDYISERAVFEMDADEEADA